MTRSSDIEAVYNYLQRYTPAPSGSMTRCAERLLTHVVQPRLAAAWAAGNAADEDTPNPFENNATAES